MLLLYFAAEGDQMKRLIIAESSGVISGVLQEALWQDYEVHICKHAKELPAVLEELRPEALIINLFLNGTDGISALAHARYKPAIILALTYIVNKHILTAAHAAGIQDILLLPCKTSHIIKHLKNLIM